MLQHELEDILGPAKSLHCSPLSFLSQFRFPSPLWQIFFCSAMGAPYQECSLALRVDRLCKC